MPSPIVVNSFSELVDAFDEILDVWEEDARIEIGSSFAFTDELRTINHGQAITISSHSGTQKLSSWEESVEKDHHYRHFTIQRGDLILENITICGYDIGVGAPTPTMEASEYGGIEVRNGGTLRIRQDSIIEYVRGADAGGILAREGSNVFMTSGEIRNCFCDTISDTNSHITGIPFGNLIRADGKLLLRDGAIHYSTPFKYNGIMIGEAGVFEMEGGIIENTVSAVFMQRGANFLYTDGIIRLSDTGIDTDYTRGRKTIVMNGGIITQNRVGIHVSEGTDFTLSNGTINNATGRDGIGILASYGNNGQFIMNGGSIYNNVQGICWQQTGISCTINGGDIYRNGYGLAVDNSVVTMRGGRIYNSEIKIRPGEIRPPNILEGGFPISGMGVMVGFEGVFNMEGGEIYGCERIGIVCIQNGYTRIINCKIHNNLIGVRFVCSKGDMEGGEIFGNYLAGVEAANFQDALETEGSTFTLNGGKIYDNRPRDPANPLQRTWGQGISVKDYSTLVINGGEIYGHTAYPQGFGAWVRNNSTAIMNGGRIYENYKAIEFGLGMGSDGRPIFEDMPGSTFTMNSGLINNNTIGITVWANCHFTMNGGEVFENIGYSSWVATTGGLGVGVCFGTFTMTNGKIHGHRGFPAAWAINTFNQPVGAAIAVLFGGDIRLDAGEIYDNIGSSGAGVYMPNEWYGPNPGSRDPKDPNSVWHAQSLRIGAGTSFYDNSATDDFPYIFDGENNTSGIDVNFINSNIFFARTSVGSHVLNNYDVNFTSKSGGFVLNRTLREFFVDECLAELVALLLDRKLTDYVAPTEFEVIKELDAEGCCIRSLGGIHYLVNLEVINLNGNEVDDISHLAELSKLREAKVYDQRRVLPQIYVTRPQGFIPFAADYSRVPVDLFKYNGKYDDELGIVTWFERGRMELQWEWASDPETGVSINFAGEAYQTAIPIPIEQLFPNSFVAREIARVLNKMTSSPIDVTELLRVQRLDLSHLDFPLGGQLYFEDLEGLEFLLKLKFLNLCNTGLVPSTAIKEKFPGVTLKFDK